MAPGSNCGYWKIEVNRDGIGYVMLGNEVQTTVVFENYRSLNFVPQHHSKRHWRIKGCQMHIAYFCSYASNTNSRYSKQSKDRTAQ